jgi:hypothetical protein
VRVGPWLGLDATSSTQRGEGGAAIDFGGGGQRSLSVEARGGGGRSVAGVSHVVGQLSVGYRFVQMRARLLNTFDGPPICPALVAPASGLRLVVSARRELEASDAWTLTLGLEWQPFGRRLGFPIW